MKVEGSAVISGIGWSQIGRRLMRDPLELTADAALAAIVDAGLSADDIDGVSTYPGQMWSTPGITGAGVDDVRAMLGLKLRWHTGGGELPGQLGSIVNAVLAVGAGLADHVLCFRTLWETTAQVRSGGRARVLAATARSNYQWYGPFGASYVNLGAMDLMRYLHDTGGTREQLAQVAVVARANAVHNPLAVYRDPMTVDDYLSSRMVSDPLCIYDCDVPVDGSMAVVVSRASSAAVDPAKAVRFEAMSSATGWQPCADMLWERTDLRPCDVDVAEVYDGYSHYVLRWLEALGLCPKNEGHAFVEGGHRIALDGELPISTGGGQLSAGRMHGYGPLIEACIQLRGLGGGRQVDPRPEVVVVTSGADLFTSSLLLSR